jgi:3-oxoacyl-[acyl-carrier-protein] synthase I
MNREPVYIAALGASTPVGRDAFSSAASVRGGVSALVEHPYMVDTAGEPMRAAIAPWLDPDMSGTARFEALLWPAIDQALESLTDAQVGTAGVAVALALPLPRPGLPGNLEESLLASLAKRYQGSFGGAAAFSKGHAAGLIAFDAACRKLSHGGLDACVVAGVDTYLEPKTLEWIEECEQYHGAGATNNAWGFIPGEAAGALLLARASVLERLGVEPLATALACGTAYEHNRIKTDTVCIGEGLTQAFRIALQALPHGMKVTDIYCDMNGEPYRADEYGFTALRTKEAFESVSEFITPADCWGDVSAAGGPLHIGLAAIAGTKGYARGPHALTWASSESGERATTLVEVRLVK